MAEEWNRNDDCQGVEIVQEIIGGAVGGHRGTLISGDGADAAVVQEPDGKVEVNFSSHCAILIVRVA